MSLNFPARKWQVVVCSLAVSALCTAERAQAQGSHRVFNVKTFGAVGDGTTNDTAAIQAALNAAANTGAQVVFPSGTYVISGHLTVSGESLIGTNATLLSSTGNTMVVLTGANVTVSGLTFMASITTGNANAVITTNATNVSFTNNTVGNGLVNGFEFVNTTGGTVSGNTFAFTNTSFGTFGVGLFGCNGVLVEKNNFSNITPKKAAAIEVSGGISNIVQQNSINWEPFASGNEAILVDSSISSQILKNTISGAGFGIVTSANQSLSVSNNVVTGSTIAGITSANDTGATFASNNLTNLPANAIQINGSSDTSVATNSIDGAGGFGVQAVNGGNISITNNAIANCGLSAAIDAVLFVSDTKATAISITGNQYKGNTAGITNFIDVLESFAVVSGNKTNSLLPIKVGP